MMALCFAIRDIFVPPRGKVCEAGIKQGDIVLDFGCGSGSHTLVAAEMTGETGKVYALDMHPLGIRKVEKACQKKGYMNVETIMSNCETNLDKGSVNVVLLYDVFHCFSDPDKVLQELHRVLKDKGIISFSDHHMKKEAAIPTVTGTGFFTFKEQGKKTLVFSKSPK